MNQCQWINLSIQPLSKPKSLAQTSLSGWLPSLQHLCHKVFLEARSFLWRTGVCANHLSMQWAPYCPVSRRFGIQLRSLPQRPFWALSVHLALCGVVSLPTPWGSLSYAFLNSSIVSYLPGPSLGLNTLVGLHIVKMSVLPNLNYRFITSQGKSQHVIL